MTAEHFLFMMALSDELSDFMMNMHRRQPNRLHDEDNVRDFGGFLRSIFIIGNIY
jgi:hypothetical protein